MFSIVLLSISCSKNDDQAIGTSITSGVITLKKANGDFVEGIVVYAYEEGSWNVTGDTALFADGQASSDSNGRALFSNLEYPNAFTQLNNFQNTFRFSAHYKINGVNKKKVKAITFKKGEQKNDEIILD